ncbi:hypothetical protein J6590_003391 [Homalodisca vitripennis]|nr:hypothetical protein J6590_003391 [Homalodisca vitripennis]
MASLLVVRALIRLFQSLLTDFHASVCGGSKSVSSLAPTVSGELKCWKIQSQPPENWRAWERRPLLWTLSPGSSKRGRHCLLFVPALSARGPPLLMEADSHLMVRKMSETRAPSKKCPLGSIVSVALTYLATELSVIRYKVYVRSAVEWTKHGSTIVQRGKNAVGIVHLEKSRGPRGTIIGSENWQKNRGRLKAVCKTR